MRMQAEQVPSKKLNRENHCLVYPLIRKETGGYELEQGWIYLGSSTAPYGRAGQSKALVFEKKAPRRESLMDVLADLEPGVYWCHGDPVLMET